MHTLLLGTGLLLAEVVSSSTEATGPPRIHAAAAAHLGLRAILQVPQPAVHVQPKWSVTRPKTTVHLKPKRRHCGIDIGGATRRPSVDLPPPAPAPPAPRSPP